VVSGECVVHVETLDVDGRFLLVLFPRRPVHGSEGVKITFGGTSGRRFGIGSPAEVGADDTALAFLKEAQVKIESRHLPGALRMAGEGNSAVYWDERDQFILLSHQFESLCFGRGVVAGMMSDFVKDGPVEEVRGSNSASGLAIRNCPFHGGIVPG